MKLLILVCMWVGLWGSLIASAMGIRELHVLLSQYYEDSYYYEIPTVEKKGPWLRLFSGKINQPLIPFDVLNRLIDDMVHLYGKQLSQPEAWLNGAMASAYIQKHLAAAGTRVAVFSDIHGSAHSLVRSLEYLVAHEDLDDNFLIKDDNFNIVMLGDYVDRGAFSPEVLYMIMQLKIKNPAHVFLLAGNHEVDHYSVRPNNMSNSLLDRYGLEQGNMLINRLEKELFVRLPHAFYYGVAADKSPIDYVLFSHAAFDPRTNVQPFLKDVQSVTFAAEKSLPRFAVRLACSANRAFESYTCDYFDDNAQATSSVGNNCMFGRDAVDTWLHAVNDDTVTIHSFIRGHQHNMPPLVNAIEKGYGYAALKDNTIHTIFSGAAACKTFLPFDSFLLIKTATTFDQWYGVHIYRQIGPSMSDFSLLGRQFIQRYVLLKDVDPSILLIPSDGKIRQEDPRSSADNLIALPSLDTDRTIAWQEKPISLF